MANFNYMGMLAVEGTYDKMNALLSQNIHPVDILLLMAASETEGDKPKIEEHFYELVLVTLSKMPMGGLLLIGLQVMKSKTSSFLVLQFRKHDFNNM
ncbi:hypothetical protein Prudu_012375 [Prunus dulcis]|uniref:Uncharacterized protein n=1 Tax=Prunus dulcis TaxID=3755 RepID=A0A4Y1RD73_PRUDU|nr:hypothetical protein Prudu_012375 [Prunus dulcis]